MFLTIFISIKVFPYPSILEIFTSFDVDGSGTLSRKELGPLLNLLGIDLTDEELEEACAQDGDGELG